MDSEKYRLIYNTDETMNNIKILGKEFVKNNKNKIKLIINNKRHILNEFITNNNIGINKIKIKMISINPISNKSYMFKNCQSLIHFSIYDIIKERNNYNVDENTAKEEEEDLEYLYRPFISDDSKSYNFYGDDDQDIFPNFSEISKKEIRENSGVST